MFITTFIKRKLASALQPWLLQEPELELTLGFLRSHVTVKNLRFNPSSLNELLEPSSSFYFTDFMISQLTLKIVNWSASAFNWEVQGFHVTICPRVGEGRRMELSEVLMEEKKKALSEIDPEGSALYDIMEKLAGISPSRSQTSSLPKLILNYCSLQMSDVKLLVRPSTLDDSFECVWEIGEFNADSRQVKPQSFLRGCQWEVISEIEKELPVPGIALARRVVRGRKVKKVMPSENELPARKHLWKDTWSLGESLSTFSALVHGNATGLSGLIYVDELSVLVEAVNNLMLSLPHAFNTVDSSSSMKSHLFNFQETSHIRSENEMVSMDLVIQKSRKINAVENEVTVSESFVNQNMSVHFLPDNGIQISVQNLHMNFSYEKKNGKMEGLAEFSGLRAVIFRHANDVMHSFHNICELSVSNCTFNLSLTHLPNGLPLSNREVGNSTSGNNISRTMEDQISEITVLNARISSSEFYLIGFSLKDVIVGKHQSSKLEMSLSVDLGCQTTVSCHCQGGIIFLETTSAVMFSQFGNSYIRRIRHLLRGRPSFQENLPAESNANITTWGIPENITMDLSQFYLALFAKDESGRIRELLFGADTNLNLKFVNMRKKLSFGLPQLSILSRVIQESNKHKNSEVQIPLMSSSTSSDPSSYFVTKDMQAAMWQADEIQSVATDARSSSSDSHQGSESYILKKLSCFISAEEPVPRDTSDTSKSNESWVGSGSISGFDVTVSLSEIQMMLAVAELSGVSSKETTAGVQQRQFHNDEEPARNFEEIVQDGSIIAIQDVHQHMYVVVEGAEKKYHLAGAMHYSLAGEMALFRVYTHPNNNA
ncbi:hypothetical protein M8C21_024427 [Ambrosia artemisiifolia]|uniref:Uncharacterized protein n=1 Tax=Ambrosia artemisiifolia TaxID=4212 RepID=A0AAD5GFH4_AMBAR|nr:hypothetical protein M8C21_024427 [Ambrosia artemisiifolia]